MEHAQLPEWESDLIDEAISSAEERLKAEKKKAKSRALQLAREQAYHRLAIAIDRAPPRTSRPGQLTLFAVEPTLFDDSE